MNSKSQASQFEIVDINVNEQARALYRSTTGQGNEWADLGDKGKEQVLTEDQILELSALVKKIEDHYGCPQDIEWCYENGEFYIVQSRPITTLSTQKDTQSTSIEIPSDTSGKNHYFVTPLFKMGVWSLLPADSMSWHGLESSKCFAKEFGFGKGLLMIHDIQRGEQIAFIPSDYAPKIKKYIDALKQDDVQGFEKKISRFYAERKRIRTELAQNVSGNYAAPPTDELIRIYKTNRDLTHHITVWDQFGWLGENVFDTEMQNILVAKGLAVGTKEYHEVLFTLTKPREISTTLSEKRDTLEQAIRVAQGAVSQHDAAAVLTQQYGWMPVFAYGTPWNEEYFTAELAALAQKPLADLQKEHAQLVAYTTQRDEAFNNTMHTYSLSTQEAQVFVDFGLMLDTRNEAEYVLSFSGYHVLPMYKEIAKRLGLSVTQVRYLTEDEIVACLQGTQDPQQLLNVRRQYFSWGFSEDMTEIYFYSEDESRRLLAHANAHADGFKGAKEGVGVCASSGTVSGTAKVVMNPSEGDKIHDGDILITQSTTVDYLPMMKRAAAFVTESGGLTCHAAVVAREFGVPCIVSLPNATKLFTDGQQVEVAADEGVVRVIVKALKEHSLCAPHNN